MKTVEILKKAELEKNKAKQNKTQQQKQNKKEKTKQKTKHKTKQHSCNVSVILKYSTH